MKAPGNCPENDQIERLLLRGDRAGLEEGLRRLDALYRLPMCGKLLRWIKAHRFGLQGEDVKDIWQSVMMSICRYAKAGTFRATGDLGGLVWNCARWRTFDFLRKRPPVEYGIDDVDRPVWRVDSAHELRELLKDKLNEFEDTERIVIESAVEFYYAENRHATRAELTVAVQLGLGSSFSKSAVSLTLSRARRKLRPYLISKGY